MRPTRRGWATVGVAGLAVVLAGLFGARSLNAVAVPAIVVLLVAAVQVRIADSPSIERSQPRAGFPGNGRTVTVEVSGSRGTIVEVTEHHSAGVSSDGATTAGTIPLAFSYEITLEARGRQSLGPAEIRLRDVFGLVERPVEVGSSTSVLVYPAVHDLGGSPTLAATAERRRPASQEIGELREYVPGDPLRHINWKASAKRLPDLVVTEFATRESAGRLAIAATADPDTVDEVASATASVALFFLEAGLEVGVAVPDGERSASRGETHRGAILELLAETGAGSVPDRAWTGADVRLAGEDGRVTIDLDGRQVPFETVRDGIEDDQSPLEAAEIRQPEVSFP